MSKSNEYHEFVKENIKENKFCVKMIQKIFPCSNNFLYHHPVDPAFLGGKLAKICPKPIDPPRLPQLKPYLERNLMAMTDFVHFECCKQEPCCTKRLSSQQMQLYRTEHANGSKVSSWSSVAAITLDDFSLFVTFLFFF